MTAEPPPQHGGRADPTPHYTDDQITLHLGDCLDVLPTLPDASIDAVICDPPYNLPGGFMGAIWDNIGPGREFQAWCESWATECLRVLKPGGHLLAFGGTRTYHRLACAIEDAGFEIRDSIHWIYGSGFPKSHDVPKAIDKAAGAEREVVGDKLDRPGYHLNGHDSGTGAFGNGLSRTTPNTRLAAALITAPATAEAERWSGWGTALKPAHEPIIVARKAPNGTVAANVLEHGTGALNIDGCRVASITENPSIERRQGKAPEREAGSWANDRRGAEAYTAERPGESLGRWPANLVLTHAPDCREVGTRLVRGDSRTGQEPGTRPGGFANVGADSGGEKPNGALHGPEAVAVFQCEPGCPVAELDRQSGFLKSGLFKPEHTDHGKIAGAYGAMNGRARATETYGDSGGASRFFPAFRYEAKASATERPKLPDGTAWPTVKPLELMRWLVRLVTPPGGTVLDPFCGTGTTGEAAIVEGFRCSLIERDPAAAELALVRLRKPLQPTLFGEAA